jgi:hypothetical protein
MTERARFAISIASPRWGYAEGQEVSVGDSYTVDEVPAGTAERWLESGVLVAVPGSDRPKTITRRRRKNKKG